MVIPYCGVAGSRAIIDVVFESSDPELASMLADDDAARAQSHGPPEGPNWVLAELPSNDRAMIELSAD